MGIEIKVVEDRIKLYIVSYTNGDEKVEGQIRLLNDLYDSFLTESMASGIIMDVKNLVPSSKAKSHSKKLVKLLEGNNNYYGTVLINAETFLEILVRVTEAKYLFNETKLRTTFAKNLSEAQDIIISRVMS